MPGLREMKCCFCMNSELKSSCVLIRKHSIKKKPRKLNLVMMINKKPKLLVAKERDRRPSMVVVLFLILLLASMITSFCFWISILCIHQSSKNTICVSPPLIEDTPKIMTAHRSNKTRPWMQMAKKKMSLMPKKLRCPQGLQPLKMQFFPTSLRIWYWKEKLWKAKWSKKKMR